MSSPSPISLIERLCPVVEKMLESSQLIVSMNSESCIPEGLCEDGLVEYAKRQTEEYTKLLEQMRAVLEEDRLPALCNPDESKYGVLITPYRTNGKPDINGINFNDKEQAYKFCQSLLKSIHVNFSIKETDREHDPTDHN